MCVRALIQFYLKLNDHCFVLILKYFYFHFMTDFFPINFFPSLIRLFFLSFFLLLLQRILMHFSQENLQENNWSTHLIFIRGIFTLETICSIVTKIENCFFWPFKKYTREKESLKIIWILSLSPSKNKQKKNTEIKDIQRHLQNGGIICDTQSISGYIPSEFLPVKWW